MTSLTEALKQKVASIGQTTKVADLQRDTLKQDQYFTNDHGAKVADVDNW